LSLHQEDRNMVPCLLLIPFKNPHVYQHEGDVHGRAN
jgi:hypothetical protein